jgi:hypothetical protein
VKYSANIMSSDCFACKSIRMAADANNMRAAEFSDVCGSLILSQLNNRKARHDAWRERK